MDTGTGGACVSMINSHAAKCKKKLSGLHDTWTTALPVMQSMPPYPRWGIARARGEGGCFYFVLRSGGMNVIGSGVVATRLKLPSHGEKCRKTGGGR